MAIKGTRPFLRNDYDFRRKRKPRFDVEDEDDVFTPVVRDARGVALGDAVARGDIQFTDSTLAFFGTAVGDSSAAGVLRAFFSAAGSAVGDSSAAAGAEGQIVHDGAGSAVGDATVSGRGDAAKNIIGSAIGDSTAEAESLDDTFVRVTEAGEARVTEGGVTFRVTEEGS